MFFKIGFIERWGTRTQDVHNMVSLSHSSAFDEQKKMQDLELIETRGKVEVLIMFY